LDPWDGDYSRPTKQNKSIIISQEKYIHDILERYGQLDARPIVTPALPNEQLVKLAAPDPNTDIHQYQSAVGVLIYAMLGTRPDLAYTIGILSQHNATPGKAHVHVLN
jgi:hypothetical protein